jgi:ATP-dependent protease ClpP protease subunit
MSAQEARDYGLIDDIITTTTPERNGRKGSAAESG